MTIEIPGKNNPLSHARRTLGTGSDLVTDKQIERLDKLFDDEKRLEVVATRASY